jgi:hypothetical protein
MPLAWIGVDSHDCRRTLTLFWDAGDDLSAAARSLRTTITTWDWGQPGRPRA